MYEASARNLRTAERFLLEPELSGHFGLSVVAVCDISAKGARIKPGDRMRARIDGVGTLAAKVTQGSRVPRTH